MQNAHSNQNNVQSTSSGEPAQTAEEMTAILTLAEKQGVELLIVCKDGSRYQGKPSELYYTEGKLRSVCVDTRYFSFGAHWPDQRIVSVVPLFVDVACEISPEVIARADRAAIDAAMQRAARDGTQVEVTTADGKTHIGDVRDDGSPVVRYRIPARSAFLRCEWLGTSECLDPHKRIVSVREVTTKTGPELITPTCCADVAPYFGRRVRIHMGGEVVAEGEITRLEVTDEGKHIFYRDRQTYGWCVKSELEGDPLYYHPIALEVLPEQPSPPEGTIYPTCAADVLPLLGRKVRVWCEGEATEPGTVERVTIHADGDVEIRACGWGWDVVGEDADNSPIGLELLEPAAEAPIVLEQPTPAQLEPFVGRRVRVYAGPERELVREATFVAQYACTMHFDVSSPWYFADHSTTVEILPS